MSGCDDPPLKACNNHTFPSHHVDRNLDLSFGRSCRPVPTSTYPLRLPEFETDQLAVRHQVMVDLCEYADGKDPVGWDARDESKLPPQDAMTGPPR